MRAMADPLAAYRTMADMLDSAPGHCVLREVG
jgi:hypothetical protein